MAREVVSSPILLHRLPTWTTSGLCIENKASSVLGIWEDRRGFGWLCRVAGCISSFCLCLGLLDERKSSKAGCMRPDGDIEWGVWMAVPHSCLWWACPPPGHRPELCHPRVCPSTVHRLFLPSYLAVFLLCLLKNTVAGDGCHGVARTRMSPSYMGSREPRPKKQTPPSTSGWEREQSHGSRWWHWPHTRSCHYQWDGRRWSETALRTQLKDMLWAQNHFAQHPKAIFHFSSHLLNTCFEPNTG